MTNIENNKFNPKKFWLNLNSLWGSTSTASNNHQTDTLLIDPLTSEKCSKDQASTVFNKFFSEIAVNIQEKIPPISKVEQNALNRASKSSHVGMHVPHYPFRFDDVPSDTLKHIISKIDNYKSSGLADITSRLFKYSIKILFTQFKHILNLSLRSGIFPDDWKKSIVTPLHKTGLLSDPNNFRPIACIPLPGKILEKCIFSQFYSFLEVNNLITPTQYGFRNNRGTQLAVAQLLDDIYPNINSNKNCLLTYIDQKRHLIPSTMINYSLN